MRGTHLDGRHARGGMGGSMTAPRQPCACNASRVPHASSSRPRRRVTAAAAARGNHSRGRRVRAAAAAAASSSFGGRPAPADVLTPHSGYHFDGSSRRFFEGWYFKVTIPSNGQSFALIYSIEDPADPKSPVGGLGVQVMGPDDGYICQFDRDVSHFWASRNALELGATIKQRSARRLRGPVTESEFAAAVEQGFQATPTWHQGGIVAAEAGAAGLPMSTVHSCSWALSMSPKVGWGDSPTAAARPQGGTAQRATAGWLSMLAVFEPHWQVLMAEGAATGWLQWGDQRYEFASAPAYAEKNWGGGFPSKWIWVQCNTFDVPGLSITAVGARRALLLGLQGVEEDVGMLGIHLPDGTFLELVPWTGQVEWEAEPWGRWRLWGRAQGYEALLEASCEPGAGTVLRAPTADSGLAPHCRDTFFGGARLRVWRTGATGSSSSGSGSRSGGGSWGGSSGGQAGPLPAGVPLVDAASSTAALEVGGGPWWAPWRAKAAMLEPFRSLVQLPIDAGALSRAVPDILKPPGL